MVFHRALASSVGVKDGTLTSRAVHLVHPPTFLGNNLDRIWCTLRNHCKTSLAEYLGGGGGGARYVKLPFGLLYCRRSWKTSYWTFFIYVIRDYLTISFVSDTRLSDIFIDVIFEVV